MVKLMRRNDREVSDINAIRGIIDKCKTCYVAVSEDGLPYVIPLSFGYELYGDLLTLFFHSAKEGRKLDILKKNPAVCFVMSLEGKPALFDNPCNSVYYYESVLGFGKVEFIECPDEKCLALSRLMKHQADRDIAFTHEQSESVCVYKITTKDFAGKKKPEPSK